MGESSAANLVESPDSNSWPWFSTLLSVLLWLLAWQAIVWFVPVQPRVVIKAEGEYLMGFSPDGKTLVTTIVHLSIPAAIYHLWDTRTGRDIGTVGDGKRNILPNVVYVSQRSLPAELSFRFTGKEDYTLYDLVTGKETETIKLDRDADAILNQVSFSPDGTKLSCGSKAHGKTKLRLIDVATGQVEVDLEEGSKFGGFSGFIFSQDGNILATTQDIANTDLKIPDEERLIVFNRTTRATRTIVADAGEEPLRLVISPDGTMLAAFCDLYDRKLDEIKGKEVRVWDAATGEKIAAFKRAPQPRHRQWFPEFVGDGKQLVLHNQDEGLTFCDLAAKKEAAPIIPIEGGFPIPIPGTNLLAVTTSYDSNPSVFQLWCGRLLGLKLDGEIQQVAFFDTKTGDKVATTTGRQPGIVDAKVFPEGKLLAVWWRIENNESYIELWDIPPRKPLRWVLGLLAIPSVVTLITIWKWWTWHKRRTKRQTLTIQTADTC